jgi:preprotein translocase subunit YajC
MGDKVVTIGGAHGTIINIEDDTVTLEVDRGIKVIFEKSAIKN